MTTTIPTETTTLTIDNGRRDVAAAALEFVRRLA